MHAYARSEIAVLSFLSLKLTSANTAQKFKHYLDSKGLEIQFLDYWILEQNFQALMLVSWSDNDALQVEGQFELYPRNTAKARCLS